MSAITFAVNPVIATLGQISAIIIGLFVLIFVLIAVAFNLAMAFGLGWVREKAELFKLLRPSVDSINKASESAMQGSTPGVVPARNENSIVRAVAQVPVQVTAADKKVEQASDSVADKVIEFRARTVQAQTILKTFFTPKPKQPVPSLTSPRSPSTSSTPGIKSPGYRILIEEQGPEKLREISAQNAAIAHEKGTDTPATNVTNH
jgi:hypothetical protein